MNFYAVLDDSDDEETPKVVASKSTATAKADGAKETKKPASTTAGPKGNSDKPKVQKDGPRKEVASAAPVALDAEVTKTAEKGGAREAGGHGPKQHRENRDRERGRRQPGKEKDLGSTNNTRRSAPEANAKRAPKSGGGSHNWGNDNEDARKVTKEGRIDGDDLDTPAADDGEAPAEAEVEVVPEPVTFSLDEYMAKRNAARANQEVFAAVKERAVDAKIDGSKVDSSLENYFVNGGLKENKSKAKDGKAKQVLAISFLAGSTEKPETERERGPRPERGSSGAGRGGRDSTRPAPRENRSGKSSAKIDIMDKSAFPTLA